MRQAQKRFPIKLIILLGQIFLFLLFDFEWMRENADCNSLLLIKLIKVLSEPAIVTEYKRKLKIAANEVQQNWEIDTREALIAKRVAYTR